MDMSARVRIWKTPDGNWTGEWSNGQSGAPGGAYDREDAIRWAKDMAQNSAHVPFYEEGESESGPWQPRPVK